MRLRRVIRSGVASLCVVAAIALAALWVRSLSTLDWIERARPDAVDDVVTAPGALRFGHLSRQRSPESPTLRWTAHRYGVPEVDARGFRTTYQRPDRSWRWLGFASDRKEYAADVVNRPGAMLPRSTNALPGYVLTSVDVPFWCPVTLLLTLPAWVGTVGWKHRRRANAGRCRACGYDLRASPDRCPECGASAERAA